MSLRSRRTAVLTTAVVLTIAMSLLAPPQRALAAPVLDQHQTGIQPIEGGNTLGGPSHQVVAQIIQAGLAGPLAGVDLPVDCNGSATLILEVRGVVSANGRFSPGSTVMTSVAFAGGNLGPKDAAGFRPFTFPNPVSFSAGDRFALVMTSAGPGSLDSCFIRHAPAGDSYASGDGWFMNDDQISPFQPGGWLCMCDSGPLSAFDHPFRTHVDVPAPSGADLSIAKTLLNPNNLNVFAATDQIYRITVVNDGPDPATNVTVVDTLPSGVTYLTGPSQCTNNAGTLTCDILAMFSLTVLPSGSAASFQFQVSFANSGSYTNTATVSANETDPDTTDNSASHTQQVLPTADLGFTSLDTDCPAGGANTCITPAVSAPGGTIRYDVTVRNFGPDPTGDVVVLQTIPASTTFVSISSTSSTICGAEPPSSTTTFGCRFSAIPMGGTRTMVVTVTAPSAPQALQTTLSATHIVPPLILDPALGFDHEITGTSWVIGESVQQSVTSTTAATTDTEGDGATLQDPLETTVQSSTGGTVSITEREQTNAAPLSWDILGAEVVISAPAGSTSAPLILTFRMDSSFLAQYDAATLQVYRNYNTIVQDCTKPVWPATASSTTTISPDPCVWKRSTLSDGDVEIIVLTSQASVWTIGGLRPFEFGGLQDPVRDGVSLMKAGRAVPLKFSLTGFQGSNVLASGSPTSRQVPCGTGASSEVLEDIDTVGNSLAYDEATDTYSIRWGTDPAWAGTCRELVLELVDGSTHTSLFEFR